MRDAASFRNACASAIAVLGGRFQPQWQLLVERSSIEPAGGERLCGLILIASIMPILFMLRNWGAPLAIDDLYRHLVAYHWGFDYRIPYVQQIAGPPFDYYVAFDHIVGWLHRTIGDGAVIVVPVAIYAIAAAAVIRMTWNGPFALQAIAVGLFEMLASSRMPLGRPSMFASAMMLLLIAYRKELRGWIPVLIYSTLVVPCYYMFFFYCIPLVLYNWRHIATLCIGFAFWLWYTDGGYFAEISVLLSTFIPVEENKSALPVFFGWWALLIPMLVYWRKDWKTALAAVFFLALNQLRYLETVYPLLISFFRYLRISLHPLAGFGIAMALATTTTVSYGKAVKHLPTHVPPGKVVLAEDMTLAYQVIYRNPDVRVTPSNHWGETQPEVRDHLTEMHHTGAVDCTDARWKPYDYFMEGFLTQMPGSCMELVSVENGKRLWRVMHAETGHIVMSAQ